MTSPKTVVYTAISGNYDVLKPPLWHMPGVRFICYASAGLQRTHPWEVRPLPRNDLDPVRQARYVKLHPHQLLPDFDTSIWIDGSILLLRNPLPLCSEYRHQSFVTFRHPTRTSLDAEADQCMRLQKTGHELVSQQIQHYLERGLPAEGNLIESNVLIRQHHQPHNVEMHKLWWEEILRWSPRDQLAFPWAVQESRFNYATMPGSSRGSNPYFLSVKHGKTLSLKDRIRAYHVYARTVFPSTNP